MDATQLKIGISLGDPRGIGPEVAAAASRVLAAERADLRLVLIGPADSPARAAAADFICSSGTARTAAAPVAGMAAGAAIEAGARLALRGDIDALVTAPIDKAALHAAGYDFPGHTELLAALAGVTAVGMLMTAESTAAGGPLRVVLATTHIALAAVPAALTIERLVTQTRIAERGLRDGWGIAQPRIALCALNPHASDGGRFGDEEERVYGPALAKLAAAGLDVTGPVPADTVFVRALRGEFDVVVAPYHDVGMAAFKTAAFGHGVNVTLGLPFIRTSPDHGTAQDIAGTGAADARSMIEAVRLAARLVARRTVLTT